MCKRSVTDLTVAARDHERTIKRELAKYAEADPTLGNKKWRSRDSTLALVASLEENRSNIGFFHYEKTNFSVVIE